MVCVPTHRITTHPGVLLLKPIREMGLSVNRVARDIRLPATRLHEIIHQRRGGLCPGCLFPASAGMNRERQGLHRVSSSVPRKRGDEPLLGILLNLKLVCSPQARG